MRKRLTKSRNNRVFFGVLGGIAEYFNISPTLVRVIFAILTLCTAGFPGFSIYLILLIVLPSWRYQDSYYEQADHSRYYQPNERPMKQAEKVQVDDDEEWSDF